MEESPESESLSGQLIRNVCGINTDVGITRILLTHSKGLNIYRLYGVFYLPIVCNATKEPLFIDHFGSLSYQVMGQITLCPLSNENRARLPLWVNSVVTTRLRFQLTPACT